MNLTCNSTLDDLRILPTSEIKVAGPLTFHDLALIISGASTLIAIALSLYLIWMHALHYTKPNEQKHVIRILFMIPVYAAASFLSLRFYWHAIYFQVISDCYEAFAISSFFALLCSYIRPDLHGQKNFFRELRPITPWVFPVNWMKKCCGGERGPWRTPASGLTWFNIIWIGIYHYCFIRVAMTITAVVTQYFDRYCESSNSPVFSHIWIIVIESIAVTIAMYCVIQFYIQMRVRLAEHSPFLKVLAIKLVIFLSFWQSAAISVGTSTLNIVHPNSVIAYPDIKVGIPSMLLCVEMACFAVLHLWAFPYRPYLDNAPTKFYPVADPDGPDPTPKVNEHYTRSGGFMGFRALFDALNIWDVVKAFGRGVRWLFVGIRHRREDISYQTPYKSSEMDLDELSPQKPGGRRNQAGVMVGDGVDTAYHADMSMTNLAGMKSTDHLPIASEFRRSRFDTLNDGGGLGGGPGVAHGVGGTEVGVAVTTAGAVGAAGGVDSRRQPSDEAAGLIAHAQPMSSTALGHDDSSPERYRDQDQLRGTMPLRFPPVLDGRGQAAYQEDELYLEDGRSRRQQQYAYGRGRPLGPTPDAGAPPTDTRWGEAR
ncbi:DUF300 domain containing protein [Niveomyces insectorum RCEF 264]|uniref:DUF300 domain containing protein n=1 Tax=Niveomyces insectorum RCEF 264 TaxID=1081102 RepID=A0A167PUD6_9HYPO|nr:DUF300 domain containing protein [Niveomyces insectorum RCEF 264]